MSDAIKPFLAGVLVTALISVSLFAGALFNGTIQRGEAVQDISDMLPPVVREMPVRKAQRDFIGGQLGGG